MSGCPYRSAVLRRARQSDESGALPTLDAHVESCRACREALERESPRLGWPPSASRPTEADPQDRPPVPPPEIPGLVLEGPLGAGGMGVVYRARHVRLGRDVAVKLLHPVGPAPADGDWLARAFREARTLALARHAHVIAIHDAGLVGDRPYLVMELAEGGTLADRLTGDPLPPGRAATLVRDVAGAIAEAHRRGILHRDLKPSNILMTTGGVPKVADFGLARRLHGDGGGELRADSLAGMGTPGYMAPEQFQGRSDERSDVYALGAVLYRCLAGRPPFLGGSPAEVIALAARHDPVPPGRFVPGLSRDLETICLKCLGTVPGSRYATAGDLADDLGRFLGDRPIRARPASPTGRAVRWARRHPDLAALSATLVLVVMAAFAATLDYAAQARRHAESASEQARIAEAARDREARLRRESAWLFEDLRGSLDGLIRPGDPRLIGNGDDLRRQLEGVMPFYERLLARRPDDPWAKPRLLWATMALAGIDATRDRQADAIPRLERAVGLARELLEDSPNHPEHANSLCRALFLLSRTRTNLGDHDAAIDLARQLFPLIGEGRRWPGHVGEELLASALLRAGRIEEARPHFERARAGLEARDEAPENWGLLADLEACGQALDDMPRFRETLEAALATRPEAAPARGFLIMDLGRELSRARCTADRRAAAAEIVAVAGPLIDHPGGLASGEGRLQILLMLARIDGAIGEALLAVDRPSEAEAHFRASLRQATRCSREFRERAGVDLVILALFGLAESRMRTGRPAALDVITASMIGESPSTFDPEAGDATWAEYLAERLARLCSESRRVGDMDAAWRRLATARSVLDGDGADPKATERARYWEVVGSVAIQAFKQRVHLDGVEVDVDAAVAELNEALEAAEKALAFDPRHPGYRAKVDEDCRRLFRYAREIRRYPLAVSALLRLASHRAGDGAASGVIAEVDPAAEASRRDGPSPR